MSLALNATGIIVESVTRSSSGSIAGPTSLSIPSDFKASEEASSLASSDSVSSFAPKTPVGRLSLLADSSAGFWADSPAGSSETSPLDLASIH